MILTTTLSAASAAALITIWLMMRCGKLRASEKIIHGDGGNPLLMQRMRAQSNFIESAPFVLILIAAIEISGKGGQGLAIVAGIYMLGRVAHAIGMDRAGSNPLRMAGVMITMLTLLGLGVMALLITLGKF